MKAAAQGCGTRRVRAQPCLQPPHTALCLPVLHPTIPSQLAVCSARPKAAALWTARQGLGLQRRTPQQAQLVCHSASTMAQDPADVIPDAYEDEDEEGKPAETPVLVVGAGPVGIITAMYLARRGYTVQIVERNADPSETESLGTPDCDVPVILSSRCLLAFEELGATDLLNGLLSVSMRGRWWVAGAPPDIVATPAATVAATVDETATTSNSTSTTDSATTSTSASAAPTTAPTTAPATGGRWAQSKAVLEEYPGWNRRYQRRVLVSKAQLVSALLVEAERLYGDKISLYYKSTFLKVDWDRRAALIATQDPNTVSARHQSMSPGLSKLDESQTSSNGDTPHTEEVWVPYGLLIGADGAESAVRTAAEKRKPKITDFDVQRPLRDSRQWKSVDSLTQTPASGEPVPGMSSHPPRRYEYIYDTPGAPTLRLWVAAEGYVRGTVTLADGTDRWDAQSLGNALRTAYGSSLPEEWLQEILVQFHGPKFALVGDAAHAMTGEYEQSFSCAVESIRLLNIALKSTQDNVDKALTLFSTVRSEDVHSMQQLEFFQRTCKPGLTYSDPMFRFAGLVAAFVWRCAMTVKAFVRSFFPDRFPKTYVTDRLWDARRGYSDLLKVIVRFAAVPIVLLVIASVLGVREVFMASGHAIA